MSTLPSIQAASDTDSAASSGEGMSRHTTVQTERIIFVYGLPRSGTTLASRLFLQYLEGGRTVPETWLFVLDHFLHKMRIKGTGRKEVSIVAALTDVGAMLDSQPCMLREIFFAACSSHSLKADGSSTDVRYGIEKTPFNVVVWDKLVEKFPTDVHVILYRDLDDTLLSTKEIWRHGLTGYMRAVLDLMELYPRYAELLAYHRANPGTFFLLRYPSMPEDVERCIAEISGGHYTKQSGSIARLQGRLGDPKQATEFSAVSRETIDPISYLELRIFFRYRTAKRIRFDLMEFAGSLVPFSLLLSIFAMRSATKGLFGR